MKSREVATAQTSTLTPEAIGTLCAQVVAEYTKPNINARTMLSMPEFWTDITLALRGETPPAADPVVTGLSPDEAEVGSADLTVSVTGTGFNAASIIVWNGGDEATTFVSETELTTIVKPSTASGAYTVPVAVRNDQVYSDPVDFTFTAAPEADEPMSGRRRR